MSMLETIAERPGLSAHFVHGTRDGPTHAMGARARDLAAGSDGRIVAATFYEAPRPEDQRGQDYEEAGIAKLLG